jgi:Ca2+-binding EF-hand superfamily protein
MRKKSEDVEMMAMFKAFDADSNGYIDSTELQTTMLSLGMKLTDDDVLKMMAEIGAEDSGKIYYDGVYC